MNKKEIGEIQKEQNYFYEFHKTDDQDMTEVLLLAQPFVRT